MASPNSAADSRLKPGGILIALMILSLLLAGTSCPRRSPAPPNVPEGSDRPSADKPSRPEGDLATAPPVLPSSSAEVSPASPDSYPYCGARDSKVFHRCDADHVHLIKPENLVRWKSREEAVTAGRHPCKLCNP